MNNRFKKKKAFTFAELMISLVIIAVITALLYPTISEISPNNNKQLFKSAYKTIELVASEISANKEDIKSSKKLCEAFKKRLNTVSYVYPAGGANSYSGCEDGAPYMMLTTSNGMRWYFADYSSGANTLYVDVNASNNKTASQHITEEVDNPAHPGEKIRQDEDGANAPATVWTNGCFRVNNGTVKDTFRIRIWDNGKVDIIDPIGTEHLKDTTE